MKNTKYLLSLLLCLILTLTGCGINDNGEEIKILKQENAQLKTQIGILQGENELLKRRVDKQDVQNIESNTDSTTEADINGVSRNSAIDNINKNEATKSSPDVRNVNFGDSMEIVKKKETELKNPYELEPDSINKALSYEGYKLRGLDTLVYYIFNGNDELCDVSIVFTDYHSNSSEYLPDFDLVEDSLETKYGKPTEEIKDFNKMAEYAPDDGAALLLGYGYYSNKWDFDNFTVEHYMSGQDHEMLHIIKYESKKYKQSTDTKGI